MHNCNMCGKDVTEHTLGEAQTCYYQSRLPREESE